MVSAPGASFREVRDKLLELRSQRDVAVAEFEWPDVGPHFNWAHDWFDPFARGNSAPALIIADEGGGRSEYSFDDLVCRSNRTARWLGKRGVRTGDAVLVMLGNQIELWVVMLAIMKLGAVIMPTTTALGTDDLADRLQRGEAKTVICNVRDRWKFDDIRGEFLRVSVGSPDQVPAGWSDFDDADRESARPVGRPEMATADPLLLYFTSGTTKKPKLVEHSNASYPVGHLTTMYWLGLQPGDVHLNISAPGWAKHAWSCFFAPWIAEAAVFVYNYTRFDAVELLKLLRSERITSFCAPPTAWRMLIKADLSDGPGSLRELAAAGEPLNREVIEQVSRSWGLTIRDGFGQTETTALIGNTPGTLMHAGSVGKPLPGAPVVLVDPLTDTVVDGVGEGEICLDLADRPIPVMTRYRDSSGSAETAVGERFYRTGDIAKIDERGYFTFVGRTDDLFKASDYKISPFELESVLIEHPAVAEAAIVPYPDPVRLAVPKAYIALASGHEASAGMALSILRHARERLAPHLRVRRVEFAAELPKTLSGKIRRADLRLRSAMVAGPDAEPQDWCDDDFPELKA